MPEVHDAETPRHAPTRLLTIGIPVFNGRSLLRSCLRSVVSSSLPHDRYEVVVADDGSTEPETLAILQELSQSLAAEPGFFRVLWLGTNSGGAARPRNRILDEAAGEYVFFVDADDTIGGHALERIAEALETSQADWVALNQVSVNGRSNVRTVREARVEVPRARALTTLTVHKVFRRAEIERQGLRFDENLPSGQDVSFAFSYILGATRFLMLGGYGYYYLTQHGDDPNEPAHLSRSANSPERLIEKNERILRSMLVALRESTLSTTERRTILRDVVLPRMLVRERYLRAVADAGPQAGPRALGRLSVLLADPLVTGLRPDELSGGVTPEHLRVVGEADWAALRQLGKQAPPPSKARPRLTSRWIGRGRRLAAAASGRARHRRVLEELGGLRHVLQDLHTAQDRLAADVRAGLDGRSAVPRDGAGDLVQPDPAPGSRG